MTRVFRVQHRADGRGPFRPGFSSQWSDDEGHLLRVSRPPWYVEVGDDAIERGGRPGEHFGSAVVTLEALNWWFSSGERARLIDRGFVVACVPDARVIAFSAAQVLFGRSRPLNVGVEVQRWP